MKKRGLRIILIVLVIGLSASGILNVKYFNENQALLEQVSENNVTQWLELVQMTNMIKENCISNNYENIIEFQLYVNNICYNFNVTPRNLSNSTKNLLTNIYDQLCLDICAKNKSNVDIETSKKVFEQLNNEIGNICAEAIEYEKAKERRTNNNIYDELTTKVTNCFNKYKTMLYK